MDDEALTCTNECDTLSQERLDHLYNPQTISQSATNHNHTYSFRGCQNSWHGLFLAHPFPYPHHRGQWCQCQEIGCLVVRHRSCHAQTAWLIERDPKMHPRRSQMWSACLETRVTLTCVPLLHSHSVSDWQSLSCLLVVILIKRTRHKLTQTHYHHLVWSWQSLCRNSFVLGKKSLELLWDFKKKST